MATFTRLNKWSIIILDLGGGHYRTDAKPIIHSPLLAKKKETTTLSRSRIGGYAGAFWVGTPKQRMRFACSLSINGSNERNHVTYVVFLIVKIVSHSLHFNNKAVDG